MRGIGEWRTKASTWTVFNGTSFAESAMVAVIESPICVLSLVVLGGPRRDLYSVDDERSQRTRSLGSNFVVSAGWKLCVWVGDLGRGGRAERSGRNATLRHRRCWGEHLQ